MVLKERLRSEEWPALLRIIDISLQLAIHTTLALVLV